MTTPNQRSLLSLSTVLVMGRFPRALARLFPRALRDDVLLVGCRLG